MAAPSNGAKSWQISVGIAIASLTLVVMIWGFGYRLGQLLTETSNLTKTLASHIMLDAHPGQDVVNERVQGKLLRIETKIDTNAESGQRERQAILDEVRSK